MQKEQSQAMPRSASSRQPSRNAATAVAPANPASPKAKSECQEIERQFFRKALKERRAVQARRYAALRL
jgi:hypothetical protein